MGIVNKLLPNGNEIKRLKIRNTEKKGFVIWIDPEIYNDENTKFVKELNSLYSINIKLFKKVGEAINYLKNIKFNGTKIIMSGKLYFEFVKSFEDNILDMCIVPKIVIFTNNINVFLDYNKEYKDMNIFYKFGGITSKFDGVKTFLENHNEKVSKDKLETKDLNDTDQIRLTFEYIDKKEKLMLPLFFKALIDIKPIDEIEQYTNLLYNTYSEENSQIKYLLSPIKSIPNIPIEILCKYYARLYTSESSFYKNMNKSLGLNKVDNYLPFIEVLYEGVKLKALHLASDNILYRGSKITKDEIDRIQCYLDKKIDNLPGSIVFSKSFLSFTKIKDKAEEFLGYENKDKNLFNVLYILEKDEKMGYNLSTHGDIEQISFLLFEREVLFFPFSFLKLKN